MQGLARVATDLHNACKLLHEVYGILLAHAVHVPADVQKKALRAYIGRAVLYVKAGFACAPKHHWAFEMIRNIQRTGNPRYSSEYPDETFNMMIASIAASVHPRTFAISVLCKYRVLCMVDGRCL